MSKMFLLLSCVCLIINEPAFALIFVGIALITKEDDK